MDDLRGVNVSLPRAVALRNDDNQITWLEGFSVDIEDSQIKRILLHFRPTTEELFEDPWIYAQFCGVLAAHGCLNSFECEWAPAEDQRLDISVVVFNCSGTSAAPGADVAEILAIPGAQGRWCINLTDRARVARSKRPRTARS